MAAGALLLYLVWFAIAVVLRVVVQQVRTGDTGLRWPAGEPGSKEWFAGLGFGFAVASGAAAPLASMLGLNPIATLDSGAIRWAGAAAASTGILLTLAAQLSMGDSWRIGVDMDETTPLVTKGAFRLARNPIFTAMLVTAVGLAAMVPNVIALVSLIATFGAVEVQVRSVEEPYLRSVHGLAYEQYESEVGRFLPGLGRRGRPVALDGRPFR